MTKEKTIAKITVVTDRTESIYYLPNKNPKLITVVIQDENKIPEIRVVEKAFLIRFLDSCGLTEDYRTENHLLIEKLIGEPIPR